MKRWGWIGIVVLFAFPGILVAQPIREATLTKIEGEVSVRIGEADWQPAKEGMVLHEPDELRTGNEGFAEIQLDGGEVARLELAAESRLRLNTLQVESDTGEKVTLLDLALGKVRVHAEKLRGDSKFEVRTPTSTTGVRGTVFEVIVEEKETD